MRREEQTYIEAIDTTYSYRFAKSMEQFSTNPVLGYRTAGSAAEQKTGELIQREMEAIGLANVHKDEIKVDAWEFTQAVMRVRTESGDMHEFQLGGYQTEFHTDGFQTFELVDVGKGREIDYKDLDVKGKLVLARMNQREEWWINFPVYQAYQKGAAAFIAVQAGGFGEVDAKALNAQDVGGPAEAPAFSISRADAAILEALPKEKDSVFVEFCANSSVRKNQHTYNITGEILGEDRESVILLSAHYDSYFSGFQDDNAAVAMMLGIGKALLDSGYHPKRTLRFCALAAEEWGIVDSKYDWSVGAYRQVFEVHPEWQGTVIADINFELPAYAHGEKAAVRCVTEYVDFLRHAVKEIKPEKSVYPKGITVRYPVQTMSDDFSMAIAGIPSMVNEFTSGEFMETHYHSQFDNEEYYEEGVYRFHHELYGRLVMAFDRTVIPPLDFGQLFLQIKNSIDLEYSRMAGAQGEHLLCVVEEAMELGDDVYRWVKKKNREYARSLDKKTKARGNALAALQDDRETSQNLLWCFRKAQDSFVRLNWHDEVLFPQEAVRENLRHIAAAVNHLEAGEIKGALESIYQIDNNRYAFMFDEEVFHHFTDYIINQEPGRLLWGAGRIVHHENLYSLVQQLRAKLKPGSDQSVEQELSRLKIVEENQRMCYCDDVVYMIHAVEKMIQHLKEIKIE